MTRTLTLTAAFALAAGGALAQTVDFDKADADGNDMLTGEELAAIVGPEAAASVVNRLDADDDGIVSLAEVRMEAGAKPAMPGTMSPAEPAEPMAGDMARDNNADVSEELDEMNRM